MTDAEKIYQVLCESVGLTVKAVELAANDTIAVTVRPDARKLTVLRKLLNEQMDKFDVQAGVAFNFPPNSMEVWFVEGWQ